MPLRNFLLTLHVVGAVVSFGPTFAMPVLVTLWRQKGPGVPTALRAAERISTLFAMPVDFIQPATGAGLIVISSNFWDPFVARNRWLLVSIIFYAIMFGLAEIIAAPAGRKAVRLAEAGDFRVRA